MLLDYEHYSLDERKIKEAQCQPLKAIKTVSGWARNGPSLSDSTVKSIYTLHSTSLHLKSNLATFIAIFLLASYNVSMTTGHLIKAKQKPKTQTNQSQGEQSKPSAVENQHKTQLAPQTLKLYTYLYTLR